MSRVSREDDGAVVDYLKVFGWCFVVGAVLGVLGVIAAVVPLWVTLGITSAALWAAVCWFCTGGKDFWSFFLGLWALGTAMCVCVVIGIAAAIYLLRFLPLVS